MLNLPCPIKNKNILMCAIGGGFDIFGALPLIYSLPDNKIFLSSYNLNKFSEPMYDYDGKVQEPFSYFPERLFISAPKVHYYGNTKINVIGKVGVVPLREYYKTLIKKHSIDIIITVDCGVDSLLKGDEAFKGTITEEYVNFAALKDFKLPKIHVCFGFGTEKEENISHYRVLENIAELIRKDGFIGSCSLTKEMGAFNFYKTIYNSVNDYTTHKKSHIHPRIIAAIDGEFGTKTSTDKTLMSGNHEVLITPFMGMYWFFNGDAVNSNIKILDEMKNDMSFIASVSRINELPKTRENKTLDY